MNKVALITSCAKGIGKELALLLAQYKYDIIITYNTSEKEALNLSKYIKDKYGVKTLTIKCDISNEDEIINMKNIIKEKYNHIGVVINISSTDSEDTYSEYNIDYSVSKAGINILTKTFALSYPNVKFIGVLPNWTDTESIREMNPEYLKSELSRIGQEKLENPSEVAYNIVNLITDNNVISGEIRRV